MRKLFLIGLIACAFAGSPNDAEANAQKLLNYQGSIKSNTGTPVNKNVNMIFRIYDSETGGASLWQENNLVKVDNGFFNTYLGTQDDLSEIDFSKELWLEINLDNGDVLPRTRLTATPYSFQARVASTADTATMAKDVFDGVLTWSKFTEDAQKAGGVLKGTYPNPSIDTKKIPDGDIPGDKIAPGNYTHFSTSPAGPAFGDMEGSTFPNLYIANNKIQNRHIQENAIANVNIQNNAVTNDKIGSGNAQKDYILASDGNGNSVWQEETDPAVQTSLNKVPKTNADGDLVNGAITDVNGTVTVASTELVNNIVIDANAGKVSTKQLGVSKIVMKTVTIADQAALNAAFAASTTVFNIDGIGNFVLPTAGAEVGQVVYVHVNSNSAVIEGNNLMQYETATFVYMGNSVWAKF